jgi:hypothetical protein
MIRYALICEHDHAFEGWFGSSDDFDDQQARGLLDCPMCASKAVRKQVMAPAVTGTKRSARETAPLQNPAQNPAQSSAQSSAQNHAMMMEMFGQLRRHVEENFDDVGDAFAREARAIHEGRAEARGIYGQATTKEARELIEDGVPVAPLPPEPLKKEELN